LRSVATSPACKHGWQVAEIESVNGVDHYRVRRAGQVRALEALLPPDLVQAVRELAATGRR
jgi:hypothetical protein